MPRLFFDSSPQVSSGLALLLILVLSVAVGWVTVISSENVIRSVENSSIVHIEKRSVSATDVNRKN